MKKIFILVFSMIFSVALIFGGSFFVEGLFISQTSTEESQDLGERVEPKASGNWSSYTDNVAHGSGTSSDPLKIYNGTDLANIAMWINDYYKHNGSYCNTLYYKLMNDIDLSAHYWFPIGVENKTFQSNHFKGVFDGGGFTIKGLTMRVYEDDSRQYMGLFGYTEGATIKNLKIKYNLTVYSITEDGWWENESCYAGGIIGRNMGSTKLDTVTILEGSKLTYNRSWDQLPFESAYISNFVGYSSGSLNIDDCVCYGDIEISASNQCRESKKADLYCGGLIGASTGSLDIDYTCHYGDITIAQPTSTDNPHNDNYQYFHVGGIVGKSAATCNIYRSIYSGSLKMTGSLWIRDGNAAVGGIVGKHTSGALTVNGCNNYADIDLSETHYMCVGGLVGSSDTSGNLNVRGCTNWGQISLRLTKEANSTGGFGGIVGQTASNYSYIRECINYGDVWFSSASYQVKFVGGILGYSLDDDSADHGRGYISNCMNFGRIGSNDGDVICVGGIAGELKDVDLSWKNWDNGKLGYSWVYVYEGVYVTNCVNMGMVYGGSSVGQIVGYLYDDLVYYNYISDKSSRPAVGNQYDGLTISATKKSLSAVCRGDFLSNASNWTSTVNDKLSVRYDSGDYYNYDTYYKIMSTQLPHGYYTSSQWSTKVGTSSLPTVIPTISGAIAGAKVTVYWNKPKASGSGYDTYSNESAVSTLCARKHGSTASGWTETTSTLTFRYLRGANYTGDRYLEAMKIVTTDTNDFTPGGFSIVSTDSNTSKQQGLDIYGTYTNGASNYIKFRGFTYSSYTEIKLRFDYYAVGKTLANSSGTPVSSLKKDVAQSASDSTSYNLLTPKFNKNSRTNNYTFYYKDTVTFEVTPSFGYRFAGLLAGDSASLSTSNAATSITNSALGKYTSGSFTYTYKQKYFTWLFDKVEYTLMFVDSASSSGSSPLITEGESDKNPKKFSDSVQSDYSTSKKFVVTGGYAQTSDDYDVTLDSIAWGFSYNLKCGFSNGQWASSNSYTGLYSNNLGKISLHMNELTRYLSSLTDSIKQNVIYIYVQRVAVELNVTLHNTVQLYTQHQTTQSESHTKYMDNYKDLNLPSYNKSGKFSVGGESFFYTGDGGTLSDSVTFSRDYTEDSNWKININREEYESNSKNWYFLAKDGYKIYTIKKDTVGIRVLTTELKDSGNEIQYKEPYRDTGFDLVPNGKYGDLGAIVDALIKSVCGYDTTRVETNVNAGIQYLKTNGVHIYVPYVLEDYILDVTAQEITGDSIDNSNVGYYKHGTTVPAENDRPAVSVVTDSNVADTSNRKKIYYYAPVSLRAKDFFSTASKAYKFVGWYLIEGEDSYRLLTTKTRYDFFIDPSIDEAYNFAGGYGLRIVAKYNASTKTAGGGSLPVVGGNYTLNSKEQLSLFSEMVAGGQSFEGKIVKLTANIEFDEDDVFTPIGTAQSPFKGIFDGQNYTISGVNFGETNTQKGVGLFGYLDGATIKNVTIAHSTVKGFSYVGMIAGYAKNSTFENVHAYECYVETANISVYNLYAEIMNGNKVSYPIDDAERGSSLDYEELVGKGDFENEIEKRECFSSLIGYAENCKLYMTSVRISDANTSLIEVKETAFYDEDDHVKPGYYFGYLVGKAVGSTTIDQSYVDAQKSYTKIPLHNGATVTNCYYRYKSSGNTRTKYYRSGTTEYVESELSNHPTIWLKINNKWVLQIFYWN